MKKHELSFDASPADAAIILEIAKRAVELDPSPEPEPLQHYRMNVTACHANGNPLRLQDLLEADDFNFAHDMWGIDRHICRDTGKLLNCFRPRFSA